jgi:hypothetical protein
VRPPPTTRAREPPPEDIEWSPLGPPLPFETIPAWLRLPGEPGYVELDQFMRPVRGKGSAG